MTVDRVRRDQLADVLAGYLRGDLDRTAVLQRLHALGPGNSPPTSAAESDQSAETIRDLLELGLEWQGERKGIGFSEEEWEGHRRELAFLSTDLEEPPWPPFEEEDWDRLVPLARWQVLLLLLALGLSQIVGWWCLAVAVLLSFAWFQWVWTAEDRARNAEVAKRNHCRPFSSREEWLAHQDRLERFHLPPYDPARHGRGKPSRLERLGRALQVGLLAGMIAFMLVCSALLWPLWLVIVACCKPSWLKQPDEGVGPHQAAQGAGDVQ
jgi:hypothetical protein